MAASLSALYVRLVCLPRHRLYTGAMGIGTSAVAAGAFGMKAGWEPGAITRIMNVPGDTSGPIPTESAVPPSGDFSYPEIIDPTWSAKDARAHGYALPTWP